MPVFLGVPQEEGGRPAARTKGATLGTRRATDAGMHRVMFGCKRAYYATLRLTRQPLKEMGLTAARFDLMYVVYVRRGWPPLQSDLRRTLGVCASVVSRMLKSLEALGYVTRERSAEDARQRRVWLTKTGRTCIKRAIRQFVTWGYAQLALVSALVAGGPRGPWWDPAKAQLALENAAMVFYRLRDAFGDDATRNYPFPDDWLGSI